MIFLPVTFVSLAVSFLTSFLSILHLQSCRVSLLLLWQISRCNGKVCTPAVFKRRQIFRKRFAKSQKFPQTEKGADEANIEVEGSEEAGDVDLPSKVRD